jgi:hypothetical protein
MRGLPYFTTEDESQWCGHVWRQRERMGGPWGVAWEVIAPFGDAVAGGWRRTQEEAEDAMNAVLKAKGGRVGE